METKVKCFTKCINTSGDYFAEYVFSDEAEMQHWIEAEMPKLSEYNFTIHISDLEPLKPNDTCKVYGEGSVVFKIVDIVKFEPYRYGFVLDDGCVESVAKCYKN